MPPLSLFLSSVKRYSITDGGDSLKVASSDMDSHTDTQPSEQAAVEEQSTLNVEAAVKEQSTETAV